jgi:tripeptide aminopeptidase
MINEKRLLDQFFEFVQIDSESGNEKAMGERLVKELESLGLEVWTDKAGETFGSNGFNVFAKLPASPDFAAAALAGTSGTGTADTVGTEDSAPWLFSAHMDTVTPGNGIKPYVEDGVIKSGPDTILGGDDKSGICGIIEAVRTVLEKGLPHRAAEICFSIGEEGGMRGAKAVDVSRLQSSRGYIFDSSGDVGKVIISAPGQIKVKATVLGKRAHAGLAPEEGISAIQAAAKGIAKMNLGRIDAETTCNIGVLKSEFATNIVPDTCEFFAEVRSRNLDKLNAQAKHMQDCLQAGCDEMGAKLDCELYTNYVSYSIDPAGDVVKPLLAAFERMGLTPVVTSGGGGSDANIYNQKGIPSVVLGTGMTKVHTKEETIKVDNLNKTAELCLELLTH